MHEHDALEKNGSYCQPYWKVNKRGWLTRIQELIDQCDSYKQCYQQINVLKIIKLTLAILLQEWNVMTGSTKSIELFANEEK